MAGFFPSPTSVSVARQGLADGLWLCENRWQLGSRSLLTLHQINIDPEIRHCLVPPFGSVWYVNFGECTGCLLWNRKYFFPQFAFLGVCKGYDLQAGAIQTMLLKPFFGCKYQNPWMLSVFYTATKEDILVDVTITIITRDMALASHMFHPGIGWGCAVAVAVLKTKDKRKKQNKIYK